LPRAEKASVAAEQLAAAMPCLGSRCHAVPR